MPEYPVPPSTPASRGRPPLSRLFLGLGLGGLLVAMAVAVPLWVWFFCRIEPGEGEIAVLIRKTGRDLPSGAILATSPAHKGIQEEVLPEGRYFRNPYTWAWRMHRMTDIPAGKLGVLIRLHGDDLPVGEILAREGTKGILPDVLGPGRHRINPFAYAIQVFDAISVRPGSVGVVTSLVGADALTGTLPAEDRNGFIVPPGQKGVGTEVLDPGTYYLNPYTVSVAEVNLQSQRFELSGEDAINFLTADGFTVHVEGTIEFALTRDKAALLTHQVGDMDDVLKKLILPRARGFSRIEGSKNPVTHYIVGEMRQKFQDNLEAHLRDQSKGWGVAIKSVLIRNITVPNEISSIIREREVATQNARMFEQQIEQARSQAQLVREEMLAVQNKEKVQADTAQMQALILAEQGRQVRLTAAQQELSVAKLESEAAAAQAQAILARAEGEQEVIRAANEAEAAVLRTQAQAFGSGNFYARYLLYQKVAPGIRTILTSDDREGLGGLFAPFLPGSPANAR